MKEVLEVEGVQVSAALGLETINAVLRAVMLELEITALRLEMPEVVQDAE